MTTENPASARQQIEDRDRAARAAGFAVDGFLIDHYKELERAPQVVYSRLTVEAALGYLIGHGLVKVAPQEEWPEWQPVEIPEHLLPDVAAAVGGNAALRNQLLGKRGSDGR
ncbi:hypothetical protein [Paractinoplanes atraurantiacus]|uniref:Uncharacterized protein n=1 Tax=Paractinoplanes atraurantiacus TaxID=1036182 RepID=A0A285GZP3_9ACTN|nr:hypothetical protein [Actinoplanes atraurantiacus]SNY28938.1 hypothetical protein SAMN05421748_103161 [Actinoplanes atraurantiacus]